MTQPYTPIRFAEKFALFAEQWSPRVIAEMNDYQFKLVRIAGDFVWHAHADTDETFIVLEGEVRIDFRDGAVVLGAGEMFVVPRGAVMPMTGAHHTARDCHATRRRARFRGRPGHRCRRGVRHRHRPSPQHRCE